MLGSSLVPATRGWLELFNCDHLSLQGRKTAMDRGKGFGQRCPPSDRAGKSSSCGN